MVISTEFVISSPTSPGSRNVAYWATTDCGVDMSAENISEMMTSDFSFRIHRREKSRSRLQPNEGCSLGCSHLHVKSSRVVCVAA